MEEYRKKERERKKLLLLKKRIEIASVDDNKDTKIAERNN